MDNAWRESRLTGWFVMVPLLTAMLLYSGAGLLVAPWLFKPIFGVGVLVMSVLLYQTVRSLLEDGR